MKRLYSRLVRRIKELEKGEGWVEHPWNRVDIIPLLRIILDDLIVKWNQKKPNEIRSKITFGKVTENDIHIVTNAGNVQQPQIIAELTENDIPIAPDKGRRWESADEPCNKRLCSIILSGDFIERYQKAGKKTIVTRVFDPLIERLRNSDPPMR